MKKMLVLLLVLSMSLPCFATAEGGSCPHTHTYEWIEGMVYEQWSSSNHQVLYGVNVQCEDCGAWLDWYGEGFFQSHSFYNGACEYCGYEKNDIPTPDELQREAFLRITSNGTSILGKTATVIHDGNVRANPGSDAEIVGSVLPDEQYLIEDYEITNGDHVWLLVQYGTGYSWVSAGLVTISGAQTVKGDADLYVGRSCTVKVSSGRGRLTPGTDGTVIDYVGYGDTYTIIDSEYVADGTLWLQIKTSNGACWISSGLVDIR